MAHNSKADKDKKLIIEYIFYPFLTLSIYREDSILEIGTRIWGLADNYDA
jgi:hypothetical protein